MSFICGPEIYYRSDRQVPEIPVSFSGLVSSFV